MSNPLSLRLQGDALQRLWFQAKLAGMPPRTLAQRMLDLGYLLAPGALFHARRQPSTLMRINFATTQEAHFWQVFQAIRAELAGGPAAVVVNHEI